VSQTTRLATTATNLVDMLTALCDATPDRTVLTFLADGERVDGQWTVAELDARARAIAVNLAGRGSPGDRALIIHPNGLEYMAAFFGTLYAGMVPVPVYEPTPSPVRRTTAGIRAIARDSGAAFAFAADPAGAACQAIGLGDLPDFRAWVTPGETDPTAADSWRRPTVNADSLAFLQYTSGSTGQPKGVMVTNGNLLNNAAAYGGILGCTAESRTVAWVPLYHDLGLIGHVIGPMAWGTDVILMTPDDFVTRPGRWLRAMSQFGGVYSAGPNFSFDLCVKRVSEQEREGLDLSSWTVAGNGAEPVRRDTLDRFIEAYEPYGFGRQAMRPIWGLAEATLVMTSSPYLGPAESSVTVDDIALTVGRVRAATDGDKRSKTLVSNGETVANHTVVVVDPATGTRCADGVVGEVWVAGPCLGQGYWQRPDATEQTFHNRLDGSDAPFLRTGDLGFLRPEGLYITGRIKDVIIVNGQNHYPQDIEYAVEGVSEALRPGCGAAFALDLDDTEFAVLVHEVNPDGLGQPEELMQAVRMRVQDEAELTLDGVFLIPPKAVPKTSSGKIQRSGTRMALLDGQLPVLASWRRDEFGESLDRAVADRTAARC
jgi:acyl-CoA synthetase (AMP-forming)/AMP-acid ligase II